MDMNKLKIKLAKAKTSLVLEHPFIGTIALNMPFEFDESNMPRVPDMDTTLMVSDQTSTELLYIDPDPNTHVCSYSTSAYPGINTPGCMLPSSTGS